MRCPPDRVNGWNRSGGMSEQRGHVTFVSGPRLAEGPRKAPTDRAATRVGAMTPDSEKALLSKLLAGDEDAFRTLVSTHHAAMTRLARSFVGQATAEEIVQEAWIKALHGLPGFEGRSSLHVWLLRIVRNEAISYLRKASRAPDMGGADDLADRYTAEGDWRVPPAAWSLDTPEALIAAQEMRAVLDKSLGELPPLQRAVLTLRDMESLSTEDVCNVLEISASSARVVLHRARRRLWAAIEAYQKGTKC